MLLDEKSGPFSDRFMRHLLGYFCRRRLQTGWLAVFAFDLLDGAPRRAPFSLLNERLEQVEYSTVIPQLRLIQLVLVLVRYPGPGH